MSMCYLMPTWLSAKSETGAEQKIAIASIPMCIIVQ